MKEKSRYYYGIPAEKTPRWSHHIAASDHAREAERDRFEKDAEPYGFDLTPSPLRGKAVEHWTDYEDNETGHRWGGWLAAKGMA